MTRKHILLSAIILAIASSIITTIPAHAATYNPGVSAGNYVKYGNISETWSSTDPSATKPQGFKDIDNTAYARADVQSVSGTSVTLKATTHFNNGTADQIMYFVGDVSSGTGNITSGTGGPFVLVIAGGLGANDHICAGSGILCTQLSINGTQSKTYAGASRTVSYISRSASLSGFSFSLSIYWDQASGMLMEVSFSSTSPSGSSNQYTTTQGEHVTATETNMWASTIFGLAPIVFYGIIGAIVAVVAIIAVAMLMRMRKPAAPGMPSPAGTTTSPPPPGQ